MPSTAASNQAAPDTRAAGCSDCHLPGGCAVWHGGTCTQAQDGLSFRHNTESCIGQELLEGASISLAAIARHPRLTSSPALALCSLRCVCLVAAVSREGWKLITLLRLSPIVPWNMLNYALAITGKPVQPEHLRQGCHSPYDLAGVCCSTPWLCYEAATSPQHGSCLLSWQPPPQHVWQHSHHALQPQEHCLPCHAQPGCFDQLQPAVHCSTD